MLTANTRAAGLSAHITGTGPSIVFLHSLLSDRGSLEPMVPLLSDSFRLVLLDLPGFGGSPRVDGGLDGQADAVAEAVAEACPGETPILFGNGYGSFLALATALRHPQLSSGLFLAGCGAGFTEEGRGAFRFMAAKAGEEGLESIAQTAMLRLFPAAMAARVPQTLAERRAAFVATDPDVFREACGILATLDLKEAARRLAVPVFACAGALDAATPPVMAQELADLVPNGTFHEIPDCAHVPTLQAPAEVAVLLTGFARTLDASSAPLAASRAG
ncbi:3-oxoadipate enol-lactonase [Xanthobacter flavus]|uniref:3-oxoadipate enol-lactonase n=1 Tax=Xanthobacter flavus TaxID=281 RepID=A0A9W6CQT9_XANFL|nr:alpha/beta fold hydrolase [Xanthobacter flavus]MDR6335366.1 3-oxoadipate enol-lactonase [Xanthobacter flavus]GLI24080.1 hydrolase [Xanthobacter flavus]